jgi:hypothetical protein
MRPVNKRETTDRTITRAISIRQPYVELILRGTTKFEYRSQPTTIRERVYIYASLSLGGYENDWHQGGSEPDLLPTGVIVGSVEIVGCEWDDKEDCFAYGLANPVRLKKHLKVVNQPLPRFWMPRFR